jgi:hypothetical protein
MARRASGGGRWKRGRNQLWRATAVNDLGLICKLWVAGWTCVRSFPVASVDSLSDAALAVCGLVRMRGKGAGAPRAGACARRARARAGAPPAGGVAPPPPFLARPPRWPRRLPLCSVDRCSVRVVLGAQHRSSRARSTTHTESRNQRMWRASCNKRSTLAPPRCAAHRGLHPPFTHPPRHPACILE